MNFSKKRIKLKRIFLLIFFRYGNTHSETSLCAQQSTKFREEARHIIKKSVNANEDDVLLFTGTGSTGAVHTLVDNFELHDEAKRRNLVVMISAFEHHSNILPWKEKGVEVKTNQKKTTYFYLQSFRSFVFLQLNKAYSI